MDLPLEALYQAKQSGKDRVVSAKDEIDPDEPEDEAGEISAPEASNVPP